jgi:hypothetical protein
MKGSHGFVPTGKKTTSGHSFPSHFGFSGSTGDVKQVGPYTRKTPAMKKGGRTKYAEGGSVEGNAATLRNQPANELDAETGGKTPLRPGFKRGGKLMRKAKGGVVAGPKTGALAAATKGTPNVVGHKKGFGSFQSKPLIGD